jgi:peptide/nickel transport system permease protein
VAIEENIRPLPDLPGPDSTGEKFSSPRAIAWTRRRRALKRFWKQYRRSKQGYIGLCVVIIWCLIAIFAPLLADHNQLSEVYAAANHQPQMMKPSWLLTEADRIELAKSEAQISEANRTDYQAITKWQYPLGTDDKGRSMWALIIYGSRISILIGLIASFMTMFIGASIGITAGFFGGRTDLILSRFIEAFLILPFILLAIMLANIFGRGLIGVCIIIAITAWSTTAYLVRGQSLAVKERPYVERARALGANNRHVIGSHILPNVFPIIFADTTLTIAVSVAFEALLSFLGLGISGSVSWGTILNGANASGATLYGAWWYVLTPGICLTSLILAVFMCGYAIEEIINPRLRSR